MFELGIVDWSDRPGAPPDWRTESEASLRYDHFLGDVVIRFAGADFKTTWGWVPVLDFASGVTGLLHDLQPGRKEVFEFTESEATLTLYRKEDFVEVTASYADGLAVVDYAKMWVAARSVLNNLRRQLCGRYPDLRSNPAFLRMVSLPEFSRPGHPRSN